MKEVVNIFESETLETVSIIINGEKIVTTKGHPFYICEKGWIRAKDLEKGDILISKNGNYKYVDYVEYERLDNSIRVYNFEVADFHTYYVSNNDVLVHNKCVLKKNGVKIDVRTSNEHGLPHAHVSGNGPKTTIGLNQSPMKNHPSFSKKAIKSYK